MKLKVWVKILVLKVFRNLQLWQEAEQQGNDSCYCCHYLTCWSFKASSLLTRQELWKEWQDHIWFCYLKQEIPFLGNRYQGQRLLQGKAKKDHNPKYTSNRKISGFWLADDSMQQCLLL